MSKQAALLNMLEAKSWQIKTSKLRIGKGIPRIEINRKREKGINVKLVVDMIIGAMDDRYDSSILISSDTDIIPAFDIVTRRFKKKIEYIGFSMGSLELSLVNFLLLMDKFQSSPESIFFVI